MADSFTTGSTMRYAASIIIHHGISLEIGLVLTGLGAAHRAIRALTGNRVKSRIEIENSHFSTTSNNATQAKRRDVKAVIGKGVIRLTWSHEY
jgi:hypothetical protein